MNNKPLSCKQIDKQGLIELYVAGKMPPTLIEPFEQHISKCEKHAREVFIEQGIRRGVQAFAREELKKRIVTARQKSDNARIIILRFAAIFIAVVLTPILLLYLFYKQEPVQLAQRIEKDSIPVVSSPMEMELSGKTEKQTDREKKERSAVTGQVPEISAEQQMKKESVPESPVPAEEDRPTEDDESSVENTSEKDIAAVVQLSHALQAEKRGKQMAAVSPVAFIPDTCNQNAQFKQILNNNELTMQAFYRSLDAPTTRIEFKLLVTPAGSVKNVQLLNISHPIPLLEDSLKKSLLQLSFPKINDTCEIHETYNFQK